MAKYRSSRLAQKKRRELKIKLVLILVIVFSFLLGVSALSKIDFLNIREFKINGNYVVKSENLNKIIDKNLEGNYFWLFSKKNILIYPKSKIKEEIIETFPRIKKINLDLDLPNFLNVDIEERKPYVLWCKNLSPAVCYYADKEGYIFSETEEPVLDELFRYYTNNNLSLRQNILKPEKFREIDSFIKFIEGVGLVPYKFVETKKEYEIYFGDFGSKIIFNENQNIKRVMNNFQSVLNMKEFSDIENFKKLEYLDLRFGNKIFYK